MRIFLFLFICLGKLYSQPIKIETNVYKTLHGEQLAFDFYKANGSGVKPTIVFVHGGSFMYGNKNLPYVAPYANKWVNEGFNFVAINYRLTLKGKTFHCNCASEIKIRTFEHAVYDIRAITRYLIDENERYNIDTSQIILSGNSAGAEAVLHTAYWNNETHNIGKALLSSSFKYAAVLAYAGALVDTNLITKENIIPTAVFHGTCDKYVPYKTAPHHYCPKTTPGALMLSGSYSIAERIKNLDESYFLYTLFKGKHKVNTLGMYLMIDQTIDFIKKTIKKTKIQSHIVEKSSEEKCNFVKIDFCD